VPNSVGDSAISLSSMSRNRKVFICVILALLLSHSFIQVCSKTSSLLTVNHVYAERNVEFMLGADVTIALELKKAGLVWKDSGVEVDSFNILSRKGMNWVRIGVTTNTTGHTSLKESIEVAEWARREGFRLYWFFFMSHASADLGKQPSPPEWQGFDLPKRAEAIRNYAKTTTAQILSAGISDHLYEVGNEIDYGFAGLFDPIGLERGDDEAALRQLRETTWRDESILLTAAIDGIRAADPEAKIVLHIAHWWSDAFALDFFKSMDLYGVRYDYVGLSFYPSSGITSLSDVLIEPERLNATRSHELLGATVTRLTYEINKPIIVSEYGYPSSSAIVGPFSWWNHTVAGYPLTPQGQKDWLRAFLNWTYTASEISGVFYYSPLFYGPRGVELWQPFALFDSSGESKPSLEAFLEFTLQRKDLKTALQARIALFNASSEIRRAETERREGELEEARSRLASAWNAYFAYEYGFAEALAMEAKLLAQNSQSTFEGIIFVSLVILVAVAAAALFFRHLGRKGRGRTLVSRSL